MKINNRKLSESEQDFEDSQCKRRQCKFLIDESQREKEYKVWVTKANGA